MKTLIPNSKQIERKWYVVDASLLPLGRLATVIADTLRGKNKTTFLPSQDMGDHVIVINSQNIKLTGNKWDDKKYYRHSGYIGSLKTTTAKKLHEDKPTEIIKLAVAGMIPRNRLKKGVLEKLYVYTGMEHPHEAQQPETLKLKK
ncbi:50S ribosomal protein L13 [Candidatus Peregrinibacteria bacterium CG11_big_fil_rev_8_21_14_0_20_41_10]|nr:MAG: 50S ribosomal protein L13 [Candidatus Peregrinibacteria bacterium CG11_big_fil_rev_8_21_14_0_20_41_10]PIZ75711.1 MAG: 50S ribosomal protein L13 [Candidatus Peregrinibacteria bacterium CG_4_10_14_0_2_um_filter_41_8]PJC37990.1 MAG: 50S ribosomal protein L13 [Candidatus Peregrinibacteria bacterium CG_4_9_14_0_2_um_filter_41_14]